MNNWERGFVGSLLLVTIGVVLIGGGVYYFINQKFGLPETCRSGEARLVIQERHTSSPSVMQDRSRVSYCSLKSISVDGTESKIVEVSYGQICSGDACFPVQESALVLNGRVYDVPQEVQIAGLMSETYGTWCGFIQDNHPEYSEPGLLISLHQISDSGFVWQYHFTNFSTEGNVAAYMDGSAFNPWALGQPLACILNGTLTARVISGPTESPVRIEADVRTLHVSTSPISRYPSYTEESYLAKCKQQVIDYRARDPHERAVVKEADMYTQCYKEVEVLARRTVGSTERNGPLYTVIK